MEEKKTKDCADELSESTTGTHCRYVLNENVSINRVIMRLENIEGFDVKNRFVNHSIILNIENQQDKKIISIFNTLSLVKKIEFASQKEGQ